MNEEKLKWYEKTYGVIGIAIVIPILLAALTVFVKWLGFDIKCSDAILTLIGILATFVVISNFIQTQSAQKHFSNELSQHKNTINEDIRANKENLKSEINRIYEKQRDADISISMIQNAIETFYSNNCDNKSVDASSFKNVKSQKRNIF